MAISLVQLRDHLGRLGNPPVVYTTFEIWRDINNAYSAQIRYIDLASSDFTNIKFLNTTICFDGDEHRAKLARLLGETFWVK